jgi:hypothetical protein
MTKRVPFTQGQVRRIILAARREGLRVAGIKPDGTAGPRGRPKDFGQ